MHLDVPVRRASRPAGTAVWVGGVVGTITRPPRLSAHDGRSTGRLTESNSSHGLGEHYFSDLSLTFPSANISPSWRAPTSSKGMYYGGGAQTQVNNQSKPLPFPFVSL